MFSGTFIFRAFTLPRWTLLLAALLTGGGLQAQPAHPRLEQRSPAGILAYLRAVVQDSLILVGQYCGVGAQTAQGYQDYVKGLHTLTGKYPALLSVEYGYTPDNDLHAINGYAIRYWKMGGLVTISWHADNPFEDGYNCRWSSIENKDRIHLEALLAGAPPSPARASYRQELMKVGRALRELQDAGVVVLWRPFHEMNGFWWWWGVDDLKTPGNTAAFGRLWKDMYETFRDSLGLHNLLWVYGANTASAWTSPVATTYPGADYVDIVGTDIYTPSPVFYDYPTLQQFGKVIAATEIGPSEEGYGSYDEMAVLSTFRGKAAWFLQWSSWPGAKVAIRDNLRLREMMQDPSALTLDDLR